MRSSSCLLVLFLHHLQLFVISKEVNVVEYLKTYGYLKNNENAITDVENAMRTFQEFYNLKTTDGKENEETLKLMEKPRCGVPDEPLPYVAAQDKWHKTQLRWYFPLATQDMLKIAKIAFEVWGNVTNLEFVYTQNDPDIVISVASQRLKHNSQHNCQMGECAFPFDGKGEILGHAFLPSGDSCREIHLDPSEKWHLGPESIEDVPSDKTSLLWVLAHELGHVLGLQHFKDPNALMYSFYGN